MVVDAFNPSRWISVFKTILVYIVNTRTVRVTIETLVILAPGNLRQEDHHKFKAF